MLIQGRYSRSRYISCLPTIPTAAQISLKVLSKLQAAAAVRADNPNGFRVTTIPTNRGCGLGLHHKAIDFLTIQLPNKKTLTKREKKRGK